MFAQLGKAGIVGLIIGGGSLILSLFTAKRTHDMADKMGKTIEELEKMTPVEVAQDVVDKAVEDAVDREVDIAVNKAVVDACHQVRSDAKQEISNQVRKEIKEVYDDLKQGVEDELTRQVEQMDITSLQESVRKRATDTAMKRLDTDISGVVGEYRERFGNHFANVANTFDVICSAATGWRNQNQNGRTMSFRID